MSNMPAVVRTRMNVKSASRFALFSPPADNSRLSLQEIRLLGCGPTRIGAGRRTVSHEGVS